MANLDECKDFLSAASEGNLTRLKWIARRLGKGEAMAEACGSIKNKEGRTALHLAAAAGKTEICQYLIENCKVEVDVRDDIGNTALHHAIIEQCQPTALYLVEIGAGIESRNLGDFAPLHYAAEKGNKELLQLLISKGAKMDINSQSGTPLHRAAQRGNTEAVKILLDTGSDPNPVTHLCFTPLMLSIMAESFECFELLLKAGADPNARSCGKTPLIVAACQGEKDIIHHLLKVGADPNVTDTSGVTPLENAAMRGHDATVIALFPATSPMSSFPNWSVAGIMKHVRSSKANQQRELARKKVFQMSKDKGTEALNRKDYMDAVFWYNEANLADPRDATILSNRSLCWALLDQGQQALQDAEACVRLKPDWPMAHYREGEAWMLLKNYTMATEAFCAALELNPDNKEFQVKKREAMEAEFWMPMSENIKVLQL